MDSVHRIRLDTLPLNGRNSMVYSNTDKAEIVADSIKIHFIFNYDIANLRIVDIVNADITQLLNTSHDNTLSFNLL